jgi:hypothetical protein
VSERPRSRLHGLILLTEALMRCKYKVIKANPINTPSLLKSHAFLQSCEILDFILSLSVIVFVVVQSHSGDPTPSV